MIIKKTVFNFLAILLIAFISQSNLLAQGDSLNLQLIKASQKGDLSQVIELLNKRADVNGKDNYGYTALIRAASNGHKDIVKKLLERGADVDAKDNGGWTALIRAASNGHKEIVKELLDKGADVNAKDKDQWTALIRAVINGHKEIVKKLLERGADVENNIGQTALIMATYKRHKEIEEILKLEQVIIKGEVLDNINKLKIEDIRWYLQRALNQLDDGSTQIYSLLPKDYRIIVDVYLELMAGNIDRYKIKERLKNLTKYYPELKDNTKAYNLLKNNLAAIYNISNEYNIGIIPIATNIFLMSGLGLDS